MCWCWFHCIDLWLKAYLWRTQLLTVKMWTEAGAGFENTTGAYLVHAEVGHEAERCEHVQNRNASRIEHRNPDHLKHAHAREHTVAETVDMRVYRRVDCVLHVRESNIPGVYLYRLYSRDVVLFIGIELMYIRDISSNFE